MGVPTGLCEVQIPSQEWLESKKKSNVVKLIFPQGSQMLYSIGSNQLARKNQKGQIITDIVAHSQHVAKTYVKKVVWVFVFNTPFDMQKFVRIVESVTKP